MNTVPLPEDFYRMYIKLGNLNGLFTSRASSTRSNNTRQHPLVLEFGTSKDRFVDFDKEQ